MAPGVKEDFFDQEFDDQFAAFEGKTRGRTNCSITKKGPKAKMEEEKKAAEEKRKKDQEDVKRQETTQAFIRDEIARGVYEAMTRKSAIAERPPEDIMAWLEESHARPEKGLDDIHDLVDEP